MARTRSKKGAHARRKGAAGEREAAAFLRENGFEARRGVQHAGGPNSPDLVHDIPGVHIEVKRVEALSLYKALAQAKGDAATGDMPVVMHRRNSEEWVAILPADWFLDLLHVWLGRDDD